MSATSTNWPDAGTEEEKAGTVKGPSAGGTHAQHPHVEAPMRFAGVETASSPPQTPSGGGTAKGREDEDEDDKDDDDEGGNAPMYTHEAIAESGVATAQTAGKEPSSYAKPVRFPRSWMWCTLESKSEPAEAGVAGASS